MDLQEWLTLNKKTQQDFAESLGIKQPSLSMILNGKRTPGLRLALDIQEATKGCVRADSWKPAKKVKQNAVG